MNASGLTRIETLNKENYDTWKMQMEALLIKNDAWSYVNGDTVKPEPGENNANQRAMESWIKNDNKAKFGTILSISPSELKQSKGVFDISRSLVEARRNISVKRTGQKSDDVEATHSPTHGRWR